MSSFRSNYVLYIQPESEEARELYKAGSAAYFKKPYTERDAGFDLFSSESKVEPGVTGKKIGQQTKAAVFDTIRNHYRAYWMMPRSSISKTPLRLANSMGLIDAGYRGTLIAAVDHIKPSSEPFVVQSGDRLCQICNSELLPWDTIVILEKDQEFPGGETIRGEGGFGSTGKGVDLSGAEVTNSSIVGYWH